MGYWTDINALLCIKQVKKNTLYNTGKSTQYSGMAYMDKGSEKEERAYVYIQLIHFALHQKLTQHCKAAILKLKKKMYIYNPCGNQQPDSCFIPRV